MNRKQKARLVGLLIVIVAPAIIGGYLGWIHERAATPHQCKSNASESLIAVMSQNNQDLVRKTDELEQRIIEGYALNQVEKAYVFERPYSIPADPDDTVSTRLKDVVDARKAT
jgi:hypothetical protein